MTVKAGQDIRRKLRASLEKFLKGAEHIALLAVGSSLRGDDAAGLLIAEKLAATAEIRKLHSKFRVFVGETAPENLTGEIRKFNPDRILIVDAADAGKQPGEVMLLNPEEIGGLSFSTHKLPLKLMVLYLQESISCAVTIIGIQPGNLTFGKPLSKAVRVSAGGVAQDIAKAALHVFSPGRTSKARK